MKSFYKISISLLLFAFFLMQNAAAQIAIFSQTYTNGATATSQCAAWNTFRSSLSSSGNYVKMTISGTYDATGITCTDKTIISAFVDAIKNTTTYISGTTSGHVWSICGTRYSGEIWIDPPSSCNGSNCPNPGYIIRPCITNSNWGGINTLTCGAPTQVMTLKFEMPTKPNDAGISAITTPLCAPDITVTYNNNGTNTLDSAKINWSVNGVIQAQNKYTTAILQGGKAVDIILKPTYNFVDGNTYTVKSWTSLPNNKADSVPANDTFSITFKYLGPSSDPGTTDIIKCGPGQVPLSATPGNPTDSLIWYNAAVGGSVIAKGKNTLSPPLVLGVNTYYVQAFKMSGPLKLANALAGTTTISSGTYNGGFINITPSNDVVIDSFTTRTSVATAGIYNIYYKVNTFVGFETNAGAWTLIAGGVTARAINVGGKNLAYIKFPEMALAKGLTYAFYITSTNSVLHYCTSSAGGFTMSNSEITVFQNHVMYGAAPFTSYSTSYYIDLEVHYRKQSCPSSRIPVKVTVKPSPNGAAFIKSTPFETTMPNTTGSIASPDIVAKGDKLTYEITPPTGYNGADYGSTWIMSGFTLKTKGGYIVPSTYYSPANPTPFGAANAKVTLTPDATLVDSNIIMTVSIRDLGPHYCDSLLTRNVFVAPRPVPEFKFGQPVCDGDNVVFSNMSTISFGYINNKWDFGTGNAGDTSVFSDAVFIFPTFGTYMVKLTTTSVPYGYSETKTYSVVVTENPKIGFKVYNACLGDSLSFINLTSISSGTIVYKWDFGNGGSSTKVNPKYKYPAAGGYKVTLKATSNGCSQILTKSAQQFARPVAKFTVPSVLCDKTEILFTNGSSIPIGNMGYAWNFGDGIFSGLTNPTHSYLTAGNKNVKLRVVSEFGCADSITKSFTLAVAPKADFATGAACNLSPTDFIFTGSKPSGYLTNFLWDFSGEGSTTIENPTKLFNEIGKKTITLTLVSNNGCGDFISKEIDVKLQSKADFEVADVCEGEEAVFINNSIVSSGNLMFYWKFGDAQTSTIPSPRHLYVSPTSQTYNVTLAAIVPGGCSDSITKAVSLNANPVSDFTLTKSGRLVYFNASQTGNTIYHWSFGDGGTAETPTAQYHYLNAIGFGRFNACLTVLNAAGCQSQTCKEILITSGIDELNKLSGIKIFPNPNSGNFSITVENPKTDISISIYNLIGELIKTVHTNPLNSDYTVDLNVANGVYLIKVTNGGLTSTQKVTVHK